MQADGANVERLIDVQPRPLLCVFLPDRLELVKGPPALRRSHVDQVVAAMWPARVGDAARLRPGARAAQRPARAGAQRARRRASSLPAWDAELARHGIALRDDRAAAIDLLAAALRRDRRGARPGRRRASCATGRGRAPRRRRASPPSSPSAPRPTSSAASPATARTATTSALLRAGRELRAYGSQGEQRLALLALLLAEREALGGDAAAPSR